MQNKNNKNSNNKNNKIFPTRRSILTKWTLLILGVWLVFWYFQPSSSANFQDKLYCSIQWKTLTVGLKKENNYLCKNYILYLQNRIYKEYQAVQQIEKLIKQRENTLFRIKIKQKKLATINNINTLIKKISHHSEKFEKNLVHIVQKYIHPTLQRERKHYEKIQLLLSKLKTTNKKILLVEKNIQSIQNHLNAILTTNSMDTIIESLTSYLYLKKTIKWILES